MKRRIWNRIWKEFGLWSLAVRPGIIVLLLVILIRITGGIQSWEWMLLDAMLRLRPVEKPDERVVIVGIDEKDIEWVKQYPIPDQKIVELLTKLETYKPLAIGLDIFKNVPVEPGGEQLAQILQTNSNIIGIEKILPPGETSPPQSLPSERVGFVDLPNDEDSKNRRYLLYTPNPKNINEDKYSLALRLVTKYLNAKGIEPQTGKYDPNTIRFRRIELPRITHLNLSGQIYGIDYHAHVISQILSSVIDSRTMLHSWGEFGEYTWIFVWGFLSIIIGRLTQSAQANLITVSVAAFCLFSCGYMMLWVWGVWIPVAPSFLILALNGVGLSAFYQHDKFLRSQINERQNTIQNTFTVIHNGPLQTLAYGLKHLRAKDIPYEQLVGQFEKLDREIREIGEFLKLEALSTEESLRLGSGLILELNRPLHDLLYEVYSSTLERQEFENFKTLKVKIRNFDPIDDKYLTIEDKRGICLFLEEVLCNVGKHAQGVKRIQASGVYSASKYSLWVKDNGSGIKSKVENKGTKYFKILAKQLGGEFRRESVSPCGTICELSWKPMK